jgi:hypothetical protein
MVTLAVPAPAMTVVPAVGRISIPEIVMVPVTPAVDTGHVAIVFATL